MANAINWFEIPAANFERAKSFYSKIMDAELPVETIMEYHMAFLPANDGGVGGAIVKGEGFEPSEKGSRIYLNGGDDLNHVLNRVEGAGGKIVQPKVQISEEIGYMATFLDSEGNKIALHSRQ
ncbi:MAG: VOC family protein [Saprospiraceae bacterium]|nr:VOC family protein [Saprospiraceae bacterium]